MSRLFGALLLGAFAVMAAAEAVRAAPAPLPRKVKEDPLLERVRKALSAYGYRLHDLRPGRDSGEWVMRFSLWDDENPSVLFTHPIRAAQLKHPEALEQVVGQISLKAYLDLDLPIQQR
jgi:hypothetical protein